MQISEFDEVNIKRSRANNLFCGARKHQFLEKLPVASKIHKNFSPGHIFIKVLASVFKFLFKKNFLNRKYRILINFDEFRCRLEVSYAIQQKLFRIHFPKITMK